MLQLLLGDIVPQTPYRGFAPVSHWGATGPQTTTWYFPTTLHRKYHPVNQITWE